MTAVRATSEPATPDDATGVTAAPASPRTGRRDVGLADRPVSARLAAGGAARALPAVVGARARRADLPAAGACRWPSCCCAARRAAGRLRLPPGFALWLVFLRRASCSASRCSGADPPGRSPARRRRRLLAASLPARRVRLADRAAALRRQPDRGRSCPGAGWSGCSAGCSW